MKLGLAIGYSRAHLDIPVKLIQRAEELGYDSVWTAEAYGSDAVTPLAYLAAVTKRIKLGTGIMQLAARTAANAAMSAGTVDALAGGGRFIAGIGVSGPQIVEGWYGEPWGKPYWRMRDYVSIMRKIFKREAPVAHEGREISLPYTGPGAMGIGNCDAKGTEIDDAIRAMNARLGLPSGLAALGVTEDLFERIIDGAMADHCHKTNPRIATREDYRDILRASM